MAIDRVSRELSEVRTVLSRARTAIENMTEVWPDYAESILEDCEGRYPSWFPAPDELTDEIVADLDQVVSILSKYSRR